MQCSLAHACFVGLPATVSQLILSSYAHPASERRVTTIATAVYIAAAYGNARCLELLLARFPQSQHQVISDDMVLPMHIASDNGELRSLQILTAQPQAPLDPRTKDRRTPLYLACQANQTECARHLIDKGANAGAQDINGVSPLHISCKWTFGWCCMLCCPC